MLQGRAERRRREARHRDTPEVFPPNDLPRPSRLRAGLGLVMMMMLARRKSGETPDIGTTVQLMIGRMRTIRIMIRIIVIRAMIRIMVRIIAIGAMIKIRVRIIERMKIMRMMMMM